jgi:hypothetical protein
LNEKKDIERATAGFIRVYNEKMRTTYRIIEDSDSPDIHCVDSDGNKLNLEITMTEDWPGDIKALLGRSDHRSIEALKAHRANVEAGKASSLELVSCLQGNLIAMLVSRIQAKLNNDYGKNVALVVRDTCPADPDWDLVVEDIKAQLDLSRNPFDKGIWILSYAKDRLFRVV